MQRPDGGSNAVWMNKVIGVCNRKRGGQAESSGAHAAEFERRPLGPGWMTMAGNGPAVHARRGVLGLNKPASPLLNQAMLLVIR